MSDLLVAATWLSGLVPFVGLEAIRLSRAVHKTERHRGTRIVLSVITYLALCATGVLFALSLCAMALEFRRS